MNAAIPERRPATEEISGLIERVTFHNDESGFCVLRVKVRGQRDETTVVGSLPSVTAGEWLSAEGWWVRDKEHGLQFKATTIEDRAADHRRGDRAVSRQRLGQGHRSDPRQEAGRAVRSRGSSRDRKPSRRTANGRWYRPQAPRANRARMAGGKASPRDHAVPAQPRREHEPGSANLQDLRRAGNREGAEQSVHAGEGHLRDRLRDRRPDRAEGWNSARLAQSGTGGHRPRAVGSDFGRSLRFAAREAQARGGQAAGSAGRDCRAGIVADAYGRLPAAGGDRRRAPDLPAAPQEGGGRHRGKDQEPI
jgi:hypothetical protein